MQAAAVVTVAALHVSAFLAVAALGAACGIGDPTFDEIALVHDACSPLSLVADTPTSIQSAGIQAAQELWSQRGVPALGRRAGGTIEIRFEHASAPFYGLYDDDTGVIYVNRSIQQAQPLAIVIAHELGHAFGLHHVSTRERPSVMNPGNLATPPTEADQRALEAIWGSCQ